MGCRATWGRRGVEVLWPTEAEGYKGMVKAYDAGTGKAQGACAEEAQGSRPYGSRSSLSPAQPHATTGIVKAVHANKEPNTINNNNRELLWLPRRNYEM